jgi:hypothetical protein
VKKQGPEGVGTGEIGVPPCVPDDQGRGTHEPVGTQASAAKACGYCGKLFAPKNFWQKFCSNPCRLSHFKRDAPPKPVKIAHPPPKGREAKDGLRCRTCREFVDNREGWRLDCKSCSRIKMMAFHNPARCARAGCVICMNATLARSTEFVAAWEAEAE